MSILRLQQRRFHWVLFTLAFSGFQAFTVMADEVKSLENSGEPSVTSSETEAETAAVSDELTEDRGQALADFLSKQTPRPTVPPSQPDGLLRFSFDGVPWRDVIRWLAEEGELALHLTDVPTGSFTYNDPSAFTHEDALDRINLFLLPEGFTLVRSGNLLSVISLGDQRSMQQLDAMAELVTVEELKDRNRHDVVKCMFPLGDIEAEEAVQELSVLKLMSTPEILEKTNQLIIIDTAAKLRNVQAILDAFKPALMDNGTVVESFPLTHVTAEDILVVARPHLGLATGEMIGIDVSVSADLQGKNIFVTGVEDKVRLLEGLVKAIDQSKQSQTSIEGEAILRSHLISGGNVETVYNVLQTLLAGKSVRLSMDESASSVVAFAPESIQQEIEQTVAQLQASQAEFAVIPLNSVDPYFVITLLEQMLDLPGPLDDPDEIDPDAPKIDADPGSMRLFVRAKKPQLEQIRKIVEGLDSGQPVGNKDELRILPLKGEQAAQLLDTAVKFWRGDNPVILYRPTDKRTKSATERVVNGDAAKEEQELKRIDSIPATRVSNSSGRVLTSTKHATGSAIRCQVTPRGLLMQSDDTLALDLFEQHLRTIAGPLDSMPSPPIVFYLQYTRADDALRLLAELLDGGDSAMDGQIGSLVNGFVSSTDSLLGSFVTSQDGTMTMTAGSMTVVADTRLNRLIAQGSTTDIEQIENYLQIIDKDNSIASIQTYGTSQVIELVNTKAADVAAVIRDAYAGRVTGATGAGQPGQPGQQGGQPVQREPQRDDEKQSKKAAPKKPSATAAKSLEPKMTVAVHEPSNSLIVTAPEQLFKEVEKLARAIDFRGEQTVEVVAPINGAVFETLLQQVMLGETGTPSRRPTTPTPSSSSAQVLRGKAGR
ncbi:MAG: secretin N-terminal domain-containing protein [Rubripirellula sp.]